MPLVRILHTRDALDAAQKALMLKGVQDAVVAVEGEAMRQGVGVLLEETVASRDSALGSLPVVLITLIRDALSAEQRRAMMRGVTEAVVAVEGEARRPAVWVLIQESVQSGEWGIGGQPLTFAAMRRIKAGLDPWTEGDVGE